VKKNISVVYLEITTILVGLLTLVVAITLTYLAITSKNIEYYRPVLWIISLSAIPAITALYYFFKQLTLIGRNSFFTKVSINNLGLLKYSLFSVSIIYTAGMPVIFYAAEQDDAPGVILIGLVLIAIFFTIGTLVRVIQKLVEENSR